MADGLVFCIGESSLPYKAEELLLKRKKKGRDEEVLVKWVCSTQPSSPEVKKSEDSQDVLLWMTNKEIKSCCPNLFNTAPTLDDAPDHSTLLPQKGGASQDGDDSLKEMSEDVSALVARAKRLSQRLAKAPNSFPIAQKNLSNTISILCAYAKLGSLAESFRGCNALDLLLDLLSSPVPHIRQGASEMLCCLARYDLTSRSYVLLQLTQTGEEEEEEGGGACSFENRKMLMELFAETAQEAESEKLFEVYLPQVMYFAEHESCDDHMIFILKVQVL